ncbi:methionine ABC transporter ATP-binding protein [Exiguobacterium flavidum]|uniref:methionine ABC transporter ATP-binding protein n=1 Tax=Exiguobacterium flavidum TaxID=2184695 RepID=UPI000DF7E031|nr:methionine ABC transporter ATP-binding protein [Exiguobacterium flavidum]
MIRLQNLAKVYKTRHGAINAVTDVDLTIERGEIFGIIGYSGAGKSTLIRLLNMLETPTSGSIQIDGVEMTTLKPKELRGVRKNVSMVFQHFNLLWSRTVEENIAFPLELAGYPKAKRAERVAELVQLVGLDGREKNYPSQLSGGQKQRVGIARALASNPDVLLCDEATSALDPKTTDSILDLLVDINQKLGLTIVLITHEMHVIQKICHRVAVMEGGKIVEQGPVLQVFRHPEQPITREFVKQLTTPNENELTFSHLRERYPTGRIVQLTFVGTSAESPILAEVMKDADVLFNIIGGSVSQTQDGAIGTLFVQLIGEADKADHSIAKLRENGVEVEVDER